VVDYKELKEKQIDLEGKDHGWKKKLVS